VRKTRGEPETGTPGIDPLTGHGSLARSAATAVRCARATSRRRGLFRRDVRARRSPDALRASRENGHSACPCRGRFQQKRNVRRDGEQRQKARRGRVLPSAAAPVAAALTRLLMPSKSGQSAKVMMGTARSGRQAGRSCAPIQPCRNTPEKANRQRSKVTTISFDRWFCPVARAVHCQPGLRLHFLPTGERTEGLRSPRGGRFDTVGNSDAVLRVSAKASRG